MRAGVCEVDQSQESCQEAKKAQRKDDERLPSVVDVQSKACSQRGNQTTIPHGQLSAVPAKGNQPLYNLQIFHLNQGRSRTKCRNSSFRDNKTTLPFIYAHGLNRLHTAPHVTTPHATGINKSGLLYCRKW